jgi:hypothetical protein
VPRPDLTALDDQVGAYLRGRGDAGAMTGEVWQAVQDPRCTGYPHVSCRHVDYGQVLRGLHRLAKADAVDVFREPDHHRGALWWVWRSLPVRIPGATLSDHG